MEEFYKKYNRSIRGFVSKKIDDEGIVEEITNDILMAGYNSRPIFDHRSSEFSWLCGIAKHKIVDYYRKKKLKTVLFSTNPIFEEFASEALDPERDALKNELKREINSTLQELGEGYSKIIRLKYIKGWRIQQIATLLKISVKAVESRLLRARRQFAACWSYDHKKAKEFIKTVDTHKP